MGKNSSPRQAMKMAANFHTTITILSLLIILIVSDLPPTFCQPPYQQNIETFYPLTPPPSPAGDTLPDAVSPPPPGRSSKRAAVGRAIGITVASTLVLSALLFFLILWLSRRRKRETEKKEKGVENRINGGTTTTTNANPVVPQNDSFIRVTVNENLKGVIVDENGLDVLYWKKLEDGGVGNRSSFNKKLFRSFKDEQREEEKRMVSGRGRKSKPPVQEAPLLRGKSSSSQSKIWSEQDDDEMIEKAPSFSDMEAIKEEEKKDQSVVELMRSANRAVPPPPLPPSPMIVGAVSKAKMAVAPSPPPPPPVVIGAVPKGKMTAATPPPPPPSNAAPPPPPKSSSSNGEGSSSKRNSEMKLKPLYWDKVNPNADHSMVWDKIDKGSFKFDGDLMEALFGYVATNRKSPRSDGRSSSPRTENSGPPSQIFILDPRKSQNTAIVLKSLGISRKEIIDALVEGEGLDSETLEKLTRIAPIQEEASEILAFNGDPTRLADAESFLYHLLKAVPSAFSRFAAMLFRTNYDSEVLQIKESLQSLESACQELKTRGLFLRLLEAVLKSGNRLNAGTSRGNAQAFNLTALRKLSDVKSSDGKTTLLQFVVQEVVRAEGKRCVLNRTKSLSRTSSRSSNSGGQSSDPAAQNDDDIEKEYMMLGLPVIGGLSSEFSNVKKAATLDYDALVKTISALAIQMDETRKVLSQCGSDRGFASTLEGFLVTAELEMQVVKEEQSRVMELVKKTRDYYHARSSRDNGVSANPLQLFVIVRDFLGMVDNVCVEIARNVQKRRPFSSFAGSSSPGSPRVFRFPKLPANFMSDNSKSSSSGVSDND